MCESFAKVVDEDFDPARHRFHMPCHEYRAIDANPSDALG